jgi:SAM-dependent methyltransferase
VIFQPRDAGVVRLKSPGGLIIKSMPGTIDYHLSEVFCPVCGLSRYRKWKNVRNWRVVECGECGMRYANPAPSDSILTEAYGYPKEKYNIFFQSDYIASTEILNSAMNWQEQNNKENLKMINKFFPQRGRMLELGCSAGKFLELAKEDGWQTAGVDPGNWEFNKEKDAELNIVRRSLFDAALEKESFDVIFMSSVLEHISNPGEYLSYLLKLLKPGGRILIMGLPNVNSLTVVLGVDKWIGNYPPLHLLYFSPKTINILLRKVGFRNITVKSRGISETVLELFFNRKSKIYTGSYSDKLYAPTVGSRILKMCRNFYDVIANIFKIGSVLEISAQK